MECSIGVVYCLSGVDSGHLSVKRETHLVSATAARKLRECLLLSTADERGR